MTTLTPELIATLRQLSPDDKDRAIDVLTEDQNAAFRAELKRRIKAYESGEMPSYSREETMAYLRQHLIEGRVS